MIKKIISFPFQVALLFWLTCRSALADLPSIEAPTSGGGSGIMGQIKGYSQDGIVLGGLIVCAVGFIVVAVAAVQTFADVRNGKSTWSTFGAIIVVGIILIVAIIWLLSKSASVIL
ncbi:TPA: TIGR03745 family integrating conjugative element membrane protein [Salmonella enterica]|uniref:TIGR03745 family integrating conjugative element membrane protein n=1 Tax=Salmonella enterica TaxID=28901 RepID=UPI0011187227|nr:TIGR03745 family integrating conjugative element membrane protein [Salmonella enterica]HBD1844108.1 TIGR03745 family integrating conjugative element membrane protein [Salmonella enterica]